MIELYDETLKKRVENMTKEIANSLIGYFESLYYLNQKTIALCGVDIEDNSGQYETMVQDVIQAIPRLIPYVYEKKTNQYVICKKDGLLEYADELTFLTDDYEMILKKHYDFLGKIKSIRNKFEHRMHGAKMISGGSTSGSIAFDVTFSIADEEVTITAQELMNLVSDLNILFSKIQDSLSQYAFEKGKSDHFYYRRLLRYRFEDFNKLFATDVLYLFGKALFPF